MDELLPAICAAVLCLGVWAAIAALAAFLAHRRMLGAERALGRRAEPAGEWRFAWYAGASIVYVTALVLAIVGLAKREWCRTGRDCTFLFLAHMTVAIACAVSMVIADASSRSGPDSPLPFVVMACMMLAAGVVPATAFAWRFAGARVARIEAMPHAGPPPGPERWAIYAASALLWPAGLAAAFAYRKPENVRIGATALRISIAQLAVIALATCTGLVVLVSLATSP